MIREDTDPRVQPGRMCDSANPVRPFSRVEQAWVLCMQRAVAIWRFSCVHGHESEKQTCAFHEPRPGNVGCQRCYNDGHECPMAFIQIGTIK